MIAYCGYMSGGKTYSAVRKMLECLYNSEIVVSNVKLNCRGVTQYLMIPCLLWKQNYYILEEHGEQAHLPYHSIDIYDYYSYPCGSPRGRGNLRVNIFLDEASSYFDSIKQSGSAEIQDLAAWVRHTEKRGQYMYLIMQFMSDLQKRLRNHVHEIIICRNTSNIRLPLVKLPLPFFLRGYVLTTRFGADEKTQLERTQWTKIDRRIYDCYDTSQIVVGQQFTQSNCITLPTGRDRVRFLGVWVWITITLHILCATLGLLYFSASSPRF